MVGSTVGRKGRCSFVQISGGNVGKAITDTDQSSSESHTGGLRNQSVDPCLLWMSAKPAAGGAKKLRALFFDEKGSGYYGCPGGAGQMWGRAGLT